MIEQTTTSYRRMTLIAIIGALVGFAGCATPPDASTAESGDASASIIITEQTDEQVRTDCSTILSGIATAGPRTVVVFDRTASRADSGVLPAALVDEIKTNSLKGGSVTVVAVNGDGAPPTVVLNSAPLSNGGPRDAPSVQDIAEHMPACVADRIAGLGKPSAAGTDFYPAVAKAAQALTTDSSMWWLTDMAFNTGQLTLASPAILNGSATAAATAAASTSPLDLQERPLHVVGIGNTRTLIGPQTQTWLVMYTRQLCAAWHATGCDDIKPVLAGAQDSDPSSDLPEDPELPFPRIDEQVGTTTVGGVEVPTCTFPIPAALTFEPDSAELTGDADTALREPLQLMTGTPTATMTIVGHTASVPGSLPQSLIDFSVLRAASAQQYFIDKTVEANRITVEGVGDTQPLAEDIDPATGLLIDDIAAAERRIDLTITGVSCP